MKRHKPREGSRELGFLLFFFRKFYPKFEIMIVKFLFVAEDKIFCTRLLVAALLHGCTIRKDGIFAEIKCRDWEHFGRCVWSAWARMSRTSEGSQIMKRRTVHVELPDFDDDVHVWYNLSDDHKRLMYGRA